MKKILTSLALATLLTTNLFSETLQSNKTIDEIHQVFTNKTVDINLTNSKRNFVYFGTLKDLQEEYANAQKLILEKGLDGALRGLENSTNAIAKGFLESAGRGIGTGLAIGIVIGVLDPYVMSLYEDEQYILIYDYTNVHGEKTRVSSLFVASDFDDEKVIKQYLENKIREVK